MAQHKHTDLHKQDKSNRRIQRELQRLLAAMLMFAFCFAGKQFFPQQTEAGTTVLRNMLTTSVDFEDAFSGLGHDLADGKGIAQSVGSWCVTVFAPQEVTLTEPDTSAPETADAEDSSQNATSDASPSQWSKRFKKLLSYLFLS